MTKAAPKRTSKRSSSTELKLIETTPSPGEKVTYQFDAEIDRALGLTAARKKGQAAFEKAVGEAAAKGFVMRGELATEGHHLVVIERPPRP
jgi:hypothetical protein